MACCLLTAGRRAVHRGRSGALYPSAGLKDRVKISAEQEEASGAAGVAFSPRETSLSVVRHRTDRDAAEESFFELLEAEVRPSASLQ